MCCPSGDGRNIEVGVGYSVGRKILKANISHLVSVKILKSKCQPSSVGHNVEAGVSHLVSVRNIKAGVSHLVSVTI